MQTRDAAYRLLVGRGHPLPPHASTCVGSGVSGRSLSPAPLPWRTQLALPRLDQPPGGRCGQLTEQIPAWFSPGGWHSPQVAIWFTADTHFGHAGALALYRRPFASVAEMDAAIVARWNEIVQPDDEVWHLGDFALRISSAAAGVLLRLLNGRKHLITGNNDPPEIVRLADWASVQAYAEIAVDTHRLVLCHYAFRTWNGMAKGALNLHGHSHGRLKPLPRQTDVGVDCSDFRPVAVHQLRGA